MEAAKAADFVARLPGNVGEKSDATQACTQALLKGTLTYVRLPKHEWPEWWRKAGFVDPVCRLDTALYGRPDSGGFWEAHCDAALQELGFVPVPAWKSVHIHPEIDLLLVVYVDDFKLCGRKEAFDKGWELIKPRLLLDPPTPIG
eukprot:14350496-Alexandrium_andersonii.AAC.1